MGNFNQDEYGDKTNIKITVKINDVIIVDGYYNELHIYIPNNTNEITLEQNNFASKRKLD